MRQIANALLESIANAAHEARATGVGEPAPLLSNAFVLFVSFVVNKVFREDPRL